jgi:ABC-type transport system involved in multi-copper enzyme maturation permease subunit
MITLRALVRLSFFEFLRDRIVWIGLFVAALIFGFSIILGSLSFNEQQRILSQLGWAAIELSTLGMSLILSANWLHKEMERQTCLLVLARPVSRSQFLLGKYLPILFLTFMLQFVLAVVLWALLGFTYTGSSFLQVFWGTFLEVAMVFSCCFFVATFMRPMLSFITGFGIYLIGHWMQEIEFFGKKYKIGFYQDLAKTVKWFLPNLFQFNWRTVYFFEHGVPADQILWCTFHAVGWLLFLVFASILIFRRKDLV